MEFRVLGPLEAEGAAGPVALGGSRQRATLALMLLHLNQAVPTSQFVDALWHADRVPSTARKILQNAVWRLRRALAQGSDAAGAPALLTRPPGYLLQVPPDQVDLHRFERLAAEGRTALAAGRPDEARRRLRAAAALWRGPVLADLTEEGAVWPEVTAVEQARLDVMEDRFEAELACGGHQAVLGELEAFTEAEPLRERAAEQLMLALYRCGRQADALSVYGRVRAGLVTGLGVEPRRQMQLLQQSILAQSTSLDLGAATGPAEPVQPVQAVRPELPERPVRPERSADAEDPHADAHQPSSVLMLRFSLGPEFDELPPEDVDRVLDTCCRLAGEEIERSGGRADAAIGSVLLGLFEQGTDALDTAERAVRAGVAVRDCLSVQAGPLAPPVPAISGLGVHAAVATGTALVCHWPDAGTGRAQPWIGGDLLDLCEQMLAQVPAGEIHVCAETRERTLDTVGYHPTRTPSEHWRVEAAGRADTGTPPAGEPDCELDLLTGVLRRVILRSAPHLVTVLAGSGTVRTRLLGEFHRRVTDTHGDAVQVLTGTVTGVGEDPASAVPAAMLAAYCGITRRDSDETALGKLTAAVRALPGPHADGASLRLLGALVTRTAHEPGPALAAWREFMTRAARTRPLVLVWDDVDRADPVLLETVESLAADCDDAALLIVVGAHARLLNRRPAWSGGLAHSMTLRLAPAAGDALDRLLQDLFTQDGNAA